ncbi:MAG: hypothetical protein EBS05_17605 [Proteobacteria bacterium]|nr:hypothetical protein [Pseudomonadota bacterium]
MSFIEIEREARALPNRKRAALVTALLGTFPNPDTDVSDAEILSRDQELEAGGVGAISHAEFVHRVEQTRRR